MRLAYSYSRTRSHAGWADKEERLKKTITSCVTIRTGNTTVYYNLLWKVPHFGQVSGPTTLLTGITTQYKLISHYFLNSLQIHKKSNQNLKNFLPSNLVRTGLVQLCNFSPYCGIYHTQHSLSLFFFVKCRYTGCRNC